METSAITYRNILTATIAADNSADSGRTYNINAEISLRGDTVSAVNNGIVSSTTDTGALAAFSATADGALNIQFFRTADNASILAAVESFIAAAREKTFVSPLQP